MAGKFSIEAIFKANDQMASVVGKVSSRLEKLSSAAGGRLGKINAVNDRVIGGLAAVGAAGAGAALAVGAGFLHVAKTGADFEQSITNVGAVMGKNRGEIQDLEKEAMRLGIVTQFSSSEVADAMEMMARKGFDSKEILQGIPGVLNAVAASGQGMAEVATVVGSAIRGFGLDAGEAGHVANVLAYAAEKTGATITDMGSALSTAAPTAKALGVSLEDTAASVGLLQKMGIDASTAGSATATMLAKISKPSKEAAKEMAALGIQFQDATGNALPFREILQQFVVAGDKAGGNMKRMGFFAELVGLRGDKAALALSDMAKSGEFDKLAEGLRNVGDYAGKVAAIRLDTTKGSWKLLTSTIEVLEIRLSELKSGALRGVIDATNAWIGANQDLIVQDVAGFFEKAIPIIREFGVGVASGTQSVADFAAGVTGALIPFDALFGSTTEGHIDRAHRLGEMVVKATAGFLAFTVMTKAAAGATVLFGLASSGAKWLTIGLQGAVGLARGAMILYETASKAGAGATLMISFASKAATADLWLQKAAAFAAAQGMGALATATGAAAAAGFALYVANQQNESLKKQTQGMGAGDIAWEAFKGFGNMMTGADGIIDPYKIVDKHQSDLARSAAAERDQQSSLGGNTLDPMARAEAMMAALEKRLSAQGSGGAMAAFGGGADSALDFSQLFGAPGQMAPARETVVKSEVTLKLPAGVTGEVTKPPARRSGASINLPPSGSL